MEFNNNNNNVTSTTGGVVTLEGLVVAKLDPQVMEVDSNHNVVQIAHWEHV
jgi:hypothetical protein